MIYLVSRELGINSKLSKLIPPSIYSLPVEIQNKAFTISQNTLNPFSEKTTISYNIPINVTKAVLAEFDLKGRMLQQMGRKW